MCKVSFPFSVIHEGRWYAPHSPFEVLESEVEKLSAIGAKVLETVPYQSKPQSESKPTKPVVKRGK